MGRKGIAGNNRRETTGGNRLPKNEEAEPGCSPSLLPGGVSVVPSFISLLLRLSLSRSIHLPPAGASAGCPMRRCCAWGCFLCGCPMRRSCAWGCILCRAPHAPALRVGVFLMTGVPCAGVARGKCFFERRASLRSRCHSVRSEESLRLFSFHETRVPHAPVLRVGVFLRATSLSSLSLSFRTK
jgi:hypothetical protein